MAHQLFRRASIVASFAALTTVGCDDSAIEVAPEAPEELTSLEPASDVVVSGAPLIHLTDFTARYDATTGAFTIEQVDPDDWAVIETIELPDGSLRTVREALWCEVNVGTAPGRVELNTVLGSIFDYPDDCGFVPPDPFYSRYADDTGMFCATVSATSHLGAPLANLHAHITEITDGFFGHRYPYGTGADPSALPDGPGKPNDLLGLWSFGDLDPEEESRVQWSFENPGGSFEFSGSLLGTFTETCNGRDDNCDGRADEGAGCFPDGALCTEAADCTSGVCTDDRCGITTVEARDIVQVGGASESSSAGHSVDIRIGTPSPAGTAGSSGHDVVLGPIHP